MPKYPTIRTADFARAVSELNIALERKRETLVYIQDQTGVAQPEITKILNGFRKKPNDAFFKLCQYAKIKYPGTTKDPINDPRIQQALAKVCDGTEESIMLITRLIECAGAIHSAMPKPRV